MTFLKYYTRHSSSKKANGAFSSNRSDKPLLIPLGLRSSGLDYGYETQSVTTVPVHMLCRKSFGIQYKKLSYISFGNTTV